MTGFLSADAHTTIASARNFNLTVSPANYLEHQRTIAKCVCDYSRPRILSMLRHECQGIAGGKYVVQVLERPLKKTGEIKPTGYRELATPQREKVPVAATDTRATNFLRLPHLLPAKPKNNRCQSTSGHAV